MKNKEAAGESRLNNENRKLYVTFAYRHSAYRQADQLNCPCGALNRASYSNREQSQSYPYHSLLLYQLSLWAKNI